MTSFLLSASAAVAAASLAVLARSAARIARRLDDVDAEARPAAESTNGTRAGAVSNAAGSRDVSPVADDGAGGGDPAPARSRASVVLEEKLRAYREISAAAIALNRAALDLSAEEFRHAADAIAMDQESDLRDPYLDVNEAYEKNLYLLDEAVRRATSEYVDYLATYHEEGAHAGGLLSRVGDVYEAMRADLGLESLFEESAKSSHDVPPDAETEATADAARPVEDFTEDLGRVEDLEYFTPRGSEEAAASSCDSADGDDSTPDAGA